MSTLFPKEPAVPAGCIQIPRETMFPAGCIQIPREAWLAIPVDSKIILIMRDGRKGDPVCLKSIQDTPDELFIITEDIAISKRRKQQPKKVAAAEVAELWKFIPETCQMEILMMLDTISTHFADDSDESAKLSSAITTIAALQTRVSLAESNLLATRRQVSALNDDIADTRRELTETRRYMESLARLIKTNIPGGTTADNRAISVDNRSTSVDNRSTSEWAIPRSDTDTNQNDFGMQFSGRAAQRRQHVGRASVTDRMYVPDDPQ